MVTMVTKISQVGYMALAQTLSSSSSSKRPQYPSYGQTVLLWAQIFAAAEAFNAPMTPLLRTEPLHRSSCAENAGGAKSGLVAEAEWVALAEGFPVDLSGTTKRLTLPKPQAIKIINFFNIIYDCRYRSSWYPRCFYLLSFWPRLGEEIIVPESFTTRQISFDRPSCCDKNVDDDFLMYHSSGLVISGPSECLNQTRGCQTTSRGRDKDQKTPIRPDTSSIQNGRYLSSKITPDRIIRLWEIANCHTARPPPYPSPTVNFGPAHNQEYINWKV
jgi:hypothetical protein